MLCRNDSRENGRGLEKIRKIITITMKRVFIVSLMLVVCLAAAAQKKKELTTLVNVNYTLPKVAYEVDVLFPDPIRIMPRKNWESVLKRHKSPKNGP